MMSFSDKLKEIRENKGMTQVELAEASGISARMIQRYEAGSSRPRMSAAESISKVLEISVDTLLGRDELAYAQLSDTYGTNAGNDFLKRAEQFSALMAGGDIPAEDREAAFKMVLAAYSQATELNKVKFNPNKKKK